MPLGYKKMCKMFKARVSEWVLERTEVFPEGKGKTASKTTTRNDCRALSASQLVRLQLKRSCSPVFAGAAPPSPSSEPTAPTGTVPPEETGPCHSRQQQRCGTGQEQARQGNPWAPRYNQRMGLRGCKWGVCGHQVLPTLQARWGRAREKEFLSSSSAAVRWLLDLCVWEPAASRWP